MNVSTAAIRGVEAEVEWLKQELATAAARVEALEQLVTEQVRATVNRDNIYGVVRCEWCDGEWTNLRGEAETEVHTKTCWVVRARTALAREGQGDG